MYTKGLTPLFLVASVLVAGMSQPAVASPDGQLFIISIDTPDPTTVSVVVAVPRALAVEAIPSSAFSLVVDDQLVELTSANPLPPSDLAIGLVIDDSDGVTPTVLHQQQSALVDLVRLLEPGTVASVGTTSGLLLASPSADKATVISGIAAAKPSDATASAAGPSGLFEGDPSRRQIVAIDVEPRGPHPDVSVNNAIASVVRLHPSGDATVETLPRTTTSYVAAGPSTLLVAVDQVGASLIGQHRLTGRVAVPSEGTLSVSLTLGLAYLTVKAPLEPAPEPTAVPTDPAPSPAAIAPAATPATAPAVVVPSAPARPPVTSAPAKPPVTSAPAAPPSPSDASGESPELALPLDSRGSAGRVPIRALAGVGVLLALGVAAGLMVFRRTPRPERVYVRVSAPYRHVPRQAHSARRSRHPRISSERRSRSRTG